MSETSDLAIAADHTPQVIVSFLFPFVFCSVEPPDHKEADTLSPSLPATCFTDIQPWIDPLRWALSSASMLLGFISVSFSECPPLSPPASLLIGRYLLFSFKPCSQLQAAYTWHWVIPAVGSGPGGLSHPDLARPAKGPGPGPYVSTLNELPGEVNPRRQRTRSPYRCPAQWQTLSSPCCGEQRWWG